MLNDVTVLLPGGKILMNALVVSMPCIAVLVVLSVSVQRKYERATQDSRAHPEATVLLARNIRNADAKGKLVADRAALRWAKALCISK
jgi:hypothetical protein